MRHTLKILLSSSFFMILAAGFFGPIYAIFVEDIGGDILTAGSAYAIFSIASGVLIFILSKWEDHIKHQEKLIIIGRLLSVVAFGGYLLVQNPYHLFAVQLLLGLAVAVTTPAFDSLYSKNLSKGKFASEWGKWEAMYGIVAGISAIVGAFIAREFGFKTLFLIMLIMAIMSLIMSLFLIKKKK